MDNGREVRVSYKECQEKQFSFADYVIIREVVYFFAIKSSNLSLVLRVIFVDFVVANELKVH